MLSLNINYEHCLDWEHCKGIDDALRKLAILTNLLNDIIVVRQGAKKDILEECSTWKGENLHKLSWDNKMIRLSELSETPELMNLWQDADTAYSLVKNKQDQVIEEIMALKKIMDVTPR